MGMQIAKQENRYGVVTPLVVMDGFTVRNGFYFKNKIIFFCI